MKNFMQLTLASVLMLSVVACKKTDGAKAETNAAATEAAMTGKEYTVNTSASKVIWEGTKPAGAHTGTVDVSAGSVSVQDGNITGGEFTLDMTSITVTDLTGDGKADLEGHLKGMGTDNKDHFFNVATYPTAKFAITKVTKLMGNPEATHLIYGNLTMRDVTKEVGFNANVQMDDQKLVVVTPMFMIDRTEWGIKYGSKKFFDDLKDKFINDEMGIKISLTAAANPS